MLDHVSVRASQSILPIAISLRWRVSQRMAILAIFLPLFTMIFLHALTLLGVLVLVALSSDPGNNELPLSGPDNELPPSRPPLPPEWPLNPGWGSTWGGANWGNPEPNMSPSSNISIGATGTPGGPPQNFQPHHFQPPMWPGPYYAQHPPAGLPGMFYPHNWGGYTYPMQQHAHMPIHDDRMAIDDDTARQNQVVPNSLGTNMHPSANSKGKKKASDEELQQQADEERICHSNDIQRDIEGELIPPEVLAIARRIHESDHVSDLEE